ncbi:hypothetical protein B0T18DRAFT_102994 [Schizothecium vesticola]|uniref:Uncharacterized protein n=1 Tax=Schizothecium vesticola TaxID=314040 RepID=A0AA40F1T4_9PEZI|nr:hypothetical protein B0T18DRAFT_102994 [Schizothecium vesticola]
MPTDSQAGMPCRPRERGGGWLRERSLVQLRQGVGRTPSSQVQWAAAAIWDVPSLGHSPGHPWSPAVTAVPRSSNSTPPNWFFVVDRSVPWAAEFAAVNDPDSARNKFEERACSTSQDLHSLGAAHLAASAQLLSPSSPRIPNYLGLLSTQTAGLQEFDQKPTPRLALIFPNSVISSTEDCRSYDRYRPLVLSRHHAFVAEGKGFLLSSEPLTMEGSSPSDLTNPAAMAEKAVPPESHPPHPCNPNIIRRRAASARQSLAGEVAPKLLLLWTAIIVRPDAEGMGRTNDRIAVLCRTAGEEAGQSLPSQDWCP